MEANMNRQMNNVVKNNIYTKKSQYIYHPSRVMNLVISSKQYKKVQMVHRFHLI